MAQSYRHAEASARHFGGVPEDYIKIHEWIDQFKGTFGDVRHRMFLHHARGPWMAQEVFGHYVTITVDGKEKKVLVRDIAENHITEDMGCIPSPGDWADCMNCHVWMGGKRNKFIGREEVLAAIAKPGRKDPSNTEWEKQ